MHSICIFTGTRAEYGLLSPLIKILQSQGEHKVQVIVSGTHLLSSYGNSISELESDKVEISATANILMASDNLNGTCNSIGLGLIKYSDILESLKPDLAIVLGDRFESFAFASAAATMLIPITHIHGGELTYGAIDEIYRHAITKMSSLHFTTTLEYKKRVIQLGEHPSSVFDVGSLGVWNSMNMERLTVPDLEASLGWDLSKGFSLFTYHPETTKEDHQKDVDAIINFFEAEDRYRVLFTGANADAGGAYINEKIRVLSDRKPDQYKFVVSLGAHRYLSALSYCQTVIGNSSSGIIEAPSFRVPTINIGDRQDS